MDTDKTILIVAIMLSLVSGIVINLYYANELKISQDKNEVYCGLNGNLTDLINNMGHTLERCAKEQGYNFTMANLTKLNCSGG